MFINGCLLFEIIMFEQSKFTREIKLFKQASIASLVFFIVLFNLSASKAATQGNLSSTQQPSNLPSPSNMVKVGLNDIPEKENFSLEYFIKEKAYLKLLKRDILPYLKQKSNKPLTCFISYAWGDCYHEYWVKRFAEMLNKAGIQVLLDRWVVRRGTILHEFIKKIEEADWVLVIGTKLYLEKYNRRSANSQEKEHVVSLEGKLIEYLIGYNTEWGNKVVPILLEGTPEECFPFMLHHKIYSEFTKNDYFEELLKLIHDLYNIDNRDNYFEKVINNFRSYAIIAANIPEKKQKAFKRNQIEKILELERQIAEDVDLYVQDAFNPREELEEVDYMGSSPTLATKTTLPKFLSYIPYPRTKEYIEREKTQQELRQKLNKEGICIVTGYGGVGKSTLVAEYGHARKEERTVRWIPAETQDKLIQAYENIAGELVNNDKYENSAQLELAQLKLKQELARLKEEPVSYPKMLASMVYNTLVEHKQLTLLILDNAVDSQLVTACLLDRPKIVQVIITTRDKKSFKNYSQVELSAFTLEEGKAYIQQRLQEFKPSEQNIEALIKEVGLIPQKLALATGYITEISFMNIDRYINKLRVLKKQGKKRQGKLVLPEANLGLEILDAPSQLIMRYGAYLDPEFIPLSLVSALLRVSDEERISDILALLEKFSLIKIINNSPNKEGIQIHREIQAACKEYQKWKRKGNNKVTEQSLAMTLLQMLVQCMPEIAKEPDATWTQAKLYFSNVTSVLASVPKMVQPFLAILYDRAAIYSRELTCDYMAALFFHQQALEIYRQIHKGKNHPDITKSLNNVGIVYKELGQYEDALTYLKQALEMVQVLYSGNHSEAANFLNNIGMVYYESNQPQEALRYFQQAFEMGKALYVGNHVNIARFLNNLGIAYRGLGQYEDALTYLKQALEMVQALYSGNHSEAANFLNNIGMVYYESKQPQEALRYFQQAFEMGKALYVGNHVNIARFLNNLGIAYRGLGQYEDALTYLKQALRMRQVLYTGNHTTIADSLNDIGLVYYETRQPQEALQYFQQALKMYQALYPNNTNHPNIQMVQRNIEKFQEEQ
mgnify:FL=1